MSKSKAWLIVAIIAICVAGLFLYKAGKIETVSEVHIASLQDVEPYRLVLYETYIELLSQPNKMIGNIILVRNLESGKKYYAPITEVGEALIAFYETYLDSSLASIERYNSNLNSLRAAVNRWSSLGFDERWGTFQEMVFSMRRLYDYVKYKEAFLLAESLKKSKKGLIN